MKVWTTQGSIPASFHASHKLVMSDMLQLIPTPCSLESIEVDIRGSYCGLFIIVWCWDWSIFILQCCKCCWGTTLTPTTLPPTHLPTDQIDLYFPQLTDPFHDQSPFTHLNYHTSNHLNCWTPHLPLEFWYLALILLHRYTPCSHDQFKLLSSTLVFTLWSTQNSIPISTSSSYSTSYSTLFLLYTLLLSTLSLLHSTLLYPHLHPTDFWTRPHGFRMTFNLLTNPSQHLTNQFPHPWFQ